MDKHLPLFDAPITAPKVAMPPANASVTSGAAKVAIRPTAGRLRKRVLEFIQQHGAAGVTDREIQAGLNMSGDTERPRRRELQQLGLIADSGMVRQTGSGRAAVVWVAVDAAEQTDVQADKPELNDLPF